jgi:membrane protease YdiL (CAAX protease family)
MEAAKINIKTLMASVTGIVLIETAAKVLIAQGILGPMHVLGVARLLDILIILLTVSMWGKGPEAIGLSPETMAFGFTRGLLWSLAFGAAAAIVFAILFIAGMNPLSLIYSELPENTFQILLFFLIGGIVGPVAEEVFFRGVLYGFFRRWGVVIAIIASTVIFVLAHAIFSRVPVTQAVGGIFFAVAYEIEGNLMVPVTIHILGNMAIFALSIMM